MNMDKNGVPQTNNRVAMEVKNRVNRNTQKTTEASEATKQLDVNVRFDY